MSDGMTDGTTGRRKFVAGMGAAVVAGCTKPPPDRDKVASAASSSEKAAASGPADSNTITATGTMPRRRLGRTNEQVSMLGIGGYHLGLPKVEEADAIRIVHAAADHGVTFFDNSWDYNEGKSEERLGKALTGGLRQKIFLMTKLDGRTKDAVTSQLETSLKRLQTDHLDLVQIHEVIRFTDAERVFAPGGAIEGLLAARKAGKVRFIGFTGHKDPDIHLAMINTAKAHGFTFDTVQMPLNVMDVHYKSFEKNVLPVAQSLDMGILGMKTLGDGVILKSKTATPTECIQYAMNLPTSVVISGCDSLAVLDQALKAAYSFQPIPPDQVAALLARTAAAGSNGEYELFKTSAKHDSTASHPEWLG
jgi:aryl-alcohol dehydrogenase-like predicted oxidoreductase